MLLLLLRVAAVPPDFRRRSHPELSLRTLGERYVGVAGTVRKRTLKPREGGRASVRTGTHCAIRVGAFRDAHPGVERRVFPQDAIRVRRHASLHKKGNLTPPASRRNPKRRSKKTSQSLSSRQHFKHSLLNC